MNFLGIALLLIFVLHLIDKHNRWRQAFKLTVALVVLSIVAVGGFFGWQECETYREEKQEQAEAAAQQAKVEVKTRRRTNRLERHTGAMSNHETEGTRHTPMILNYRNGGSSKLRSLRECSAPRSPRSKSRAAIPIFKCSPTAR